MKDTINFLTGLILGAVLLGAFQLGARDARAGSHTVTKISPAVPVLLKSGEPFVCLYRPIGDPTAGYTIDYTTYAVINELPTDGDYVGFAALKLRKQ